MALAAPIRLTLPVNGAGLIAVNDACADDPPASCAAHQNWICLIPGFPAYYEYCDAEHCKL
jgi:hypothetical protein